MIAHPETALDVDQWRADAVPIPTAVFGQILPRQPILQTAKLCLSMVGSQVAEAEEMVWKNV